jgi:hypothetical protein
MLFKGHTLEGKEERKSQEKPPDKRRQGEKTPPKKEKQQNPKDRPSVVQDDQERLVKYFQDGWILEEKDGPMVKGGFNPSEENPKKKTAK